MMGDSKTQQQATKLGTSCVQPSIVQELVPIVSNDLKRLLLYSLVTYTNSQKSQNFRMEQNLQMMLIYLPKLLAKWNQLIEQTPGQIERAFLHSGCVPQPKVARNPIW